MSDVFSFAALHRAYRACRRSKRSSLNALAFEVDAESKLLALRQELHDHTYRPGSSICFVTGGPKPREVFAADFRDRIVHHVLVDHQTPIFEPRFIHDSYACRPGKGTLAASNRLMQLLRRITANGRRPAWALKLDVASFFASIDKEVLYAILCRHVRDPEIRWLTRVVLFHDPTGDYRFRAGARRTPGPRDARYPVPAGKSLFGGGNRRGLPIGNLTSQFWANVYLNELDRFAKRVLGCRWYVRYVDDVVLLSEEPAQLRAWRDAILEFLRRVLHLALREPVPEPAALGRGVDFVGWKTWRSHRVVRRQTLGNLRGRVRRFARRRVKRAFGAEAACVELAARPLAALHASLASYAGHLRHGAAWHDWTRLWDARPWLGALFMQVDWQVRSRWQRRAPRAFPSAYAALLSPAPAACLVFFPMGRFVEFYGPQRLLAERVLGLRRTRLARGEWAFAAGFHRRHTARFALHALRRGQMVLLTRTDGAGRAMSQRPAALLVPRARPSGATAKHTNGGRVLPPHADPRTLARSRCVGGDGGR